MHLAKLSLLLWLQLSLPIRLLLPLPLIEAVLAVWALRRNEYRKSLGSC
jgi:hypothetical protein